MYSILKSLSLLSKLGTLKKVFLAFLLFTFSCLLCEGQSWVWGAEAQVPNGSEGGDIMQTDHSVCADNFGNVFYTGYFTDTLSFGTDTLVSPNCYNMFIVKHDHFGNIRWARQSIPLVFNSTYASYGYDVATDINGNVIVIGGFSGTMTFGFDTVYSGLFIVKYDSTGNVLWAKQLSGINGTCTSLVGDRFGNSYLGGWFEGTGIFGNDTLNTIGYNAFLVKYNSNGILLWAKSSKQVDSSGSCEAWSLASDKNGNVYLTGGFTEERCFGNDTIISTSSSGDFFIAKYDSLGNINWVRTSISSGNSSTAVAWSLAVDGSNMLYVTGQFVNTLLFNADSLISKSPNGDLNIFLVKYDNEGDFKWARQSTEMIPVTSQIYWASFSVACDTLKRGGCYLGLWLAKGRGGRYYIGFNGDTLSINTSNPTAESIMKFDSSGNALCGSIFTEGIEDDGDGLNVDPSGEHVYFDGDLANTCIFGNDTLVCIPYREEIPFVACWRPCDALTLGVKGIENDNHSIHVFPNPSNGNFTVSLSNVNAHLNESSGQEKCNVEIYNVFGEKVLTETLGSAQGDNAIDLSSQPSGIYLYRVISETGALLGSGKVVITH